MTTHYHYTSVEGIRNILLNGTLRATDIRFLNDYREFDEGLKHVENRLIELSNNFGRLGLSNREVDAVKKFYETLSIFLPLNARNRYSYVTSFTDKRDRLSQWMAYGKSNASYCIGFKSDFFQFFKEKFRVEGQKELISDLSYNFKEVSYEGIEYVNSIIESNDIFEAVNNAIMLNHTATQLLAPLHKIYNELMYAICSIKPKEFADESEFRLIFQTRKIGAMPNILQFYDRSGIVVPFIDYAFDYKWIEEIIIGPNIQKDLARKGLETLLRAKGIDPDIIKHTECTLRQY